MLTVDMKLLGYLKYLDSKKKMVGSVVAISPHNTVICRFDSFCFSLNSIFGRKKTFEIKQTINSMK